MSAMRGTAAYGRGANAYARISIESGVMSASPHQLIVMLFDGAIASIRTARIHMEADNTAEKGKAISRSMDIINNGLLAALDAEKGGEIAERLASLYDYVTRQLLAANLHNDIACLDQAEAILNDLAGAWKDVGEPVAAKE